ncbi:DUF333 domain-containing protein [Candidatus Parcubacteria bacterium]|nr:DUF333 domain-containing protein [Candidatus Parcubacteria bacterium]
MKEHKNKKLVISATVILAGLCVFSAVESVLAMSNPAAIYCRDLGYEYAVEKTSEGELGFCKLPDGSKAEEWKFFTGQEKQDYNYCGTKGYATKTVSDERCLYSGLCALCVLDDGSEKEVSRLMGLSVPAPEYTVPFVPTISPASDNPILSDTNNFVYYIVALMIFVVLLLIAFIMFKTRKNNDVGQ